MIFLFDFLDIEPGSNIINYEFGSTKLNSSDYSFLGINVINDNINDNNYAIIISVNDKEKVFNIFKKVQFLKKENGQRKIYIICKIYNKKYKLFKSFINLFRVKNGTFIFLDQNDKKKTPLCISLNDPVKCTVNLGGEFCGKFWNNKIVIKWLR